VRVQQLRRDVWWVVIRTHLAVSFALAVASCAGCSSTSTGAAGDAGTEGGRFFPTRGDAAADAVSTPDPTKSCVDGSDACGACLNASCCGPIEACQNDSGCEAIVDCAYACGTDQTCIDDCRSSSPDGASLFDQFTSCVQNKCNGKCGS
jgi:hypothetical protein